MTRLRGDSLVAHPPARSRHPVPHKSRESVAVLSSVGPRVTGIDAARGCAMLLVCVSHIKEHFTVSDPALYELLVIITRIATPTFLLLSGFVIAHVLQNSKHRNVGVALVDRALFLLIVAHALFGLSKLSYLSVPTWFFGRAVITDAIGVALLVGVMARNASARILLAAGAACVLLAWPIAMTLSPETNWGRHIATLFFHAKANPTPDLDAPLVPYIGVFLIGMGLSRCKTLSLQKGDRRALAARFGACGLMAVILVGIAIGLFLFTRETGRLNGLSEQLLQGIRLGLDPRSKWPPSPAYILFYGGAGLCMTGALLALEARQRGEWVVRHLAVLGRASLMCFVVQDWLLLSLPEWLGLQGISTPLFWAPYLVATVAVLYVLSRKWDQVRGNRFLSVGLRRLSPEQPPLNRVDNPGRTATHSSQQRGSKVPPALGEPSLRNCREKS